MSGQRGTSAEIAKRNDEIVVDRARGMSWGAIERKHGITTRQCQNVWTKFADERKPALEGQDPLDVIVELIEGYRAQEEHLAELSDETDVVNEKIAAIREQRAHKEARTELLQAIGYLPKNLGTLAIEVDVRFLAQTVVEILDRHDVPVDARKELVEALRHRS